jgi:acyl carrier protein
MKSIEKYNKAFSEALEINENELTGLKYQETPLWDSVGHMSLISNLEEVFDIMIETDDIVDLSSYEKGIEILKKYDVEF